MTYPNMRWGRPLLKTTLCVLLAGCAGPQVVVQEPPPAAAPVRGITVMGTGKASGQPDIARVSVGVEVRAPTAEQATREANQRIAAIITRLKAAGIADKDLRTTNFSIYFEKDYEHPPRPVPAPDAPPVPTPRPSRPAPGKGAPPNTGVAQPQAPVVAGHYRASNQLEVIIRDLNRAGEILGIATEAGANQVHGIQFELENPQTLEAEARTKAMADARQRAERLAQLAGVPLGPVVSVTDQGGGMPIPGPVMMRSEQADVPIERGELTVSSSVQVVYAIGGAGR